MSAMAYKTSMYSIIYKCPEMPSNYLLFQATPPSLLNSKFIFLLLLIILSMFTILLWPFCNSGGEMKALFSPFNFSLAGDHCWQQLIVNRKLLCNVFLRRHNSSSSNGWAGTAWQNKKGPHAQRTDSMISIPLDHQIFAPGLRSWICSRVS